MKIKIVYLENKITEMTHLKIDKWEIKGNLLQMYRGNSVEVIYNINKIISFYKVDQKG